MKQQENIKVSNLAKEKCQICTKETIKLSLLICVTCQQLDLLSIMCKRCALNHHKTNTHIGKFVKAYPNEVFEI